MYDRRRRFITIQERERESPLGVLQRRRLRHPGADRKKSNRSCYPPKNQSRRRRTVIWLMLEENSSLKSIMHQPKNIDGLTRQNMTAASASFPKSRVPSPVSPLYSRYYFVLKKKNNSSSFSPFLTQSFFSSLERIYSHESRWFLSRNVNEPSRTNQKLWRIFFLDWQTDRLYSS